MRAVLLLIVLVVACDDQETVAIVFAGDDASIELDATTHMTDGPFDPVGASDSGMRRDGGPFDQGIGPRVFNPHRPRVPNPSCRLPEPPPIGDYTFERAFPNLTFERPVWIGTAPHDNATMFVVEQGGLIRTFDNQPTAREARTFFDLSVSRRGNEEGLLGLAFHPSYEFNGRFYVHYSAGQDRCDGVTNVLFFFGR